MAGKFNNRKPEKGNTDNDDENDDNDDNDCRTNATTVRASNLHSSSLNMTNQDVLMEALIRRVLSHFPHPNERAIMVHVLNSSFWDRAGDDRAEYLRSLWRSHEQAIDESLVDELLTIRVDSRPLFLRHLELIDREMTMTRSRQVVIDSDSSISANAGSGSARVQNTPFGDPGHDTADNEGATNEAVAVAVPAPTPEERAVAVPHGNTSLTRNPRAANLEGLTAQPAAVVPPAQPVAVLPNPPAAVALANQLLAPLPSAAAAPLNQPVADVRAVPPVRANSPLPDCCLIL